MNDTEASSIQNDSIGKGRYYIGSWLYFRMLALVYFIAFFSAGIQTESLYGSNGILPLQPYFESLRANHVHWSELPGIFWWFHDDASIRLLPLLGVLASLLLAAGVLQTPMLLIMWLLYLSLVSAGSVFFSFQWDTLLLEMGFLSIFFSPWTIRSIPGKDSEPSPYFHWALLFLLFRVMFFSGYVKLASGDPSWRNLTALQYHYETQPLPNPLSWWFHQLPDWWHTIEALLMFAIELMVPFLLFAGSRIRNYAALLLIFLQVLISLSGNFCFFNVQTLALIVLAIDDRAYISCLRRRSYRDAVALLEQWRKNRRRLFPDWTHAMVVFLWVLLVAHEIKVVKPYVEYLPYSSSLSDTVKPFRIANSYGVFAVMTTKRFEVILEGSDDGKNWKPYVLPWQPGPLDRMPGQVAPFQARLDWRMWFVPFSSCQQNRWLPGLYDGLLRNLPPVVRLFSENPFSERPPKMIRAMIYEYHFAPFGSDQWWTRGEGALFCPPMGLATPCTESSCSRPEA